MSLGTTLYIISMKWDNLVIAKLFGTGIAGEYNLARNLADLPAAHVGEQIGDVLTPSFARMDDDASRKRALSRAGGLLALVVFPMAIGLGAVGPTVRDTFLNEKWVMVGSMLAVLSMLSVVRPIGWLAGSYLYARKYPRTIMLLEVLKASSILSFVLLLGQFGALWACAGVGVAFGIHALGTIVAVRHHDGVPMSDLLTPLARPLIACVPMLLAVLAARSAVAGTGMSAGWRLVVEVVTGAVVYTVAALIVAGPHTRDAQSLVVGALRRT